MTQQEKVNLGKYLAIRQPVNKIYASSFLRPNVSKSLRQAVYHIVQQSQQVLAELAIKPEWQAKCFEGFYPFIITMESNRDILAAIKQELCKTQNMYILSLDFSMYSNCDNYTTVLNTIQLPVLCRIAIKRWLKGPARMLQANECYLKHLWDFTAMKKYIWPVQITIYLFIHKLLIWLDKENISISFACFKHNSQLLFLHYNSVILRKIAHFIGDWLTSTSVNAQAANVYLCRSMNGFEFRGYKIQKKSIKQDIIIAPAPKSQMLLVQYLTRIIKESKHVSSYQLICRLSAVITYWGEYFEFTRSARTFQYLDYLICTKLWLWALRRHSRWSKNRIKQKYFPKNKRSLYKNQLISNNYNFCSVQKSSLDENKGYFLIRFVWFKLAKRLRSVS